MLGSNEGGTSNESGTSETSPLLANIVSLLGDNNAGTGTTNPTAPPADSDAPPSYSSLFLGTAAPAAAGPGGGAAVATGTYPVR